MGLALAHPCRLEIVALGTLAYRWPVLATQYFQVSRFPGDKNGDQAYVLPLENPTHIAHAHELIENGLSAGSPLVVALISPGSNGVNHNTLAAGESFWSWHVEEFQGFGDIAIELCDGSSQFVENNVAGWIANMGGQICFWSYTVTGLVTESMPGDYDENGTVDATDYPVWRNTSGSQADLRTVGDQNGIVDLSDYHFWKDRFNSRMDDGSKSRNNSGDDRNLIPQDKTTGAMNLATIRAVPEPSATWLLFATTAGFVGHIRNRWQSGHRWGLGHCRWLEKFGHGKLTYNEFYARLTQPGHDPNR